MEPFAGHESIAQWTQYQWLEEWKKPGVPPHSLPPPEVGSPDPWGSDALRSVNSFRTPGVNADLASPPPALRAWLEENDLTA